MIEAIPRCTLGWRISIASAGCIRGTITRWRSAWTSRSHGHTWLRGETRGIWRNGGCPGSIRHSDSRIHYYITPLSMWNDFSFLAHASALHDNQVLIWLSFLQHVAPDPTTRGLHLVAMLCFPVISFSCHAIKKKRVQVCSVRCHKSVRSEIFSFNMNVKKIRENKRKVPSEFLEGNKVSGGFKRFFQATSRHNWDLVEVEQKKTKFRLKLLQTWRDLT